MSEAAERSAGGAEIAWLVTTSPADLRKVTYELGCLRQLARAWSGLLADHRRRDMAALFAVAALASYRDHAASDAQLSPLPTQPLGKLELGASELAGLIGREAAPLPVKHAAHFITGLYTALLPTRQRGSLGAFYTPPALAERLLDLAEEQELSWAEARVLDPASGGGAFLLPAAERMIASLGSTDPIFVLRQLETRLVGFELDPYAAGLGQNALELLLADVAKAAGRPVPELVRVVDTLEEVPSASFDLVVGNPPYGRIRLGADQRRRFHRSLYGHANLYGVFTDLALRWVKSGGIVAYLTPTSFLSGRYYKSLRGLLAREAPPAAIDFVADRSGVFEDVLQETMLAIYRCDEPPGPVQLHYVRLSADGEALVTCNGIAALPEPADRPWLLPREPGRAHLIEAAAAMKGRLADWGYRVSTGPLVWNRHKGQLRDRPSKGALPLIWAEAVAGDGRFMFRAERRNHAPYFKPQPGDEWLIVREPCVLLQRTTAKEQARRLIAAELPAEFVDAHDGVVVENHLNMVRAVGRPKVSPRTVAAVLNSNTLDHLFRCLNGSVAVSAYELEELPLPPASAMKSVERLVDEGADREAIEHAISALYVQPPA